MQLPREELERRLSALDEALVMLRADAPGEAALRAAFIASADSIRALAGCHHEYVSTRLSGILAANGLEGSWT